jgi:tripartite-type tricarboxylate transporter receptor subunit TctC
MQAEMSRRSMLVLSLGCVMTEACADAYPSRPVKFVVGFASGGAPDIFARTLASQLGAALGQTIFVDGRMGAGGTISATQVAAATPDGYTLLIAETGQIELAPLLYKKIAYDPVKDFTHIARLTASPGMGIVTSGKRSSISSMQELIDTTRREPGKLSYGSSGIGSIHHIAIEVIKADLGLDILHVPFKGSSESLQAVLAGDIQIGVGALQSIMEQVRSGDLRLLATTGSKRFSGTPGVPCMADYIPNYQPVVSQFSMLGPARMPTDIVERLSRVLREILAQPATVARLAALNYEAVWSSPQDYKLEVEDHLKRYAQILKRIGIEPS